MSNIMLTSNFVNGPSCSYARLKTYSNCARNEVKSAPAPAPAPVSVASPPAAAPAPAAAVPEGYLDPSPMSLPGNANSGEKNYTPSYTVPDYAPIATSTFSGSECGGYRKILNAYGGMESSGSCVTKYMTN